MTKYKAEDLLAAWDLFGEVFVGLVCSANGQPKADSTRNGRMPKSTVETPAHRLGRVKYNNADNKRIRRLRRELAGKTRVQQDRLIADCAKELGRTSRTIKQQMTRIGLSRPKPVKAQ